MSLNTPSQEDTCAVLKESISRCHLGLKMLYDELAQNKFPDKDLSRTIIANLEYLISDFHKKLGVESQTSAEVEQRHALLRAANFKVHELTQQLALKTQSEVSGEQLGSLLKHLSQKLEYWWDMEGFGHIRSIDYIPAGIKISLSCSLFGGYYNIGSTSTMSDTPVSSMTRKEAWLLSLEEKGYHISEEEDGRDPQLTDCDENKKILFDTISKAFPSARITAVKSYIGKRPHIDLVDLIVYNFDEVFEKPSPPKTER